MRNSVFFAGLGIALLAASSAARAQAVETVMAPAVGPAVVVQGPVAVPPSGVLLPPASAVAVAAPVETVETVRTVTTTEPRRVRHRAVRPRTVDRVTTITRTTTVRPGVVAPGVVAAAPVYEEPMQRAAPLRHGDLGARRRARGGVRGRDDNGDRGADAGLSICLPA